MQLVAEEPDQQYDQQSTTIEITKCCPLGHVAHWVQTEARLLCLARDYAEAVDWNWTGNFSEFGEEEMIQVPAPKFRTDFGPPRCSEKKYVDAQILDSAIVVHGLVNKKKKLLWNPYNPKTN
jgi:hypothetical protein